MVFTNRTAVFFRGLSGCGKSTQAKQLAVSHERAGLSAIIHETDSFFYDDSGTYRWDADKIKLYHYQNQKNFIHSLEQGIHLVINSNTNTQYWEFAPYFEAALQQGYSTVVIDLYDSGLSDKELFERSQHSFPLEKYSLVRRFYERDMKNLDSRIKDMKILIGGQKNTSRN